MKPYFLTLLAAGAFLGCGSVHAQGLLAIGQNSDYPENIPLTYTVSVGGGFDRIEYETLDPNAEDVDSYFLQGGIGAVYGVNDRTTKWNIGLDFGAIQYLDDAEREEDLFYNARAAFNITHQVNRRLTISDNFYLTYEIEPDYGVGVSTGRRDGQYLYGYNNASVAYAWSERVTTTTGYTVDGIRYLDDDVTAEFEDRLSHTISQQVSYALSRTTTLTAEYRYRITNYDGNPEELEGEDRDFSSHFILVGLDQAWSERLTASLRAGAEIYESDRKSETAPYVEGAVNYALTRKTAVRAYVQSGFDGSELGLYDSRYSIRTGLTASHQFTQRLTGYTGVHYVFSQFEGSDEIEDSDENEFNASLGLNYNFWNNLSLDANYSFTTIDSDISSRNYDRNRVHVGLNATF